MLTIKKLEPFLELREVNFQDYLFQLLPATTILECQGTTYRNTIFHRQRFVYKEGINDGSEFQVGLPPDLRPPVKPISVAGSINDFYKACINPVVVSSTITTGINRKISAVKVSGSINQNNLDGGIKSWTIEPKGRIEGGRIKPRPVPVDRFPFPRLRP